MVLVGKLIFVIFSTIWHQQIEVRGHNCSQFSLLNSLVDDIFSNHLQTLVLSAKSPICSRSVTPSKRIINLEALLQSRNILKLKAEVYIVWGPLSDEDSCKIALKYSSEHRPVLVESKTGLEKCPLSIVSNILIYTIEGKSAILREAYKVSNDQPVILNHIATIINGSSTKDIDNRHIWERRGNLGGHQFSAATGLDFPWTNSISKHQDLNGKVTFQPMGILPGLIGWLSHKLNMSVIYTGRYTSWAKMVKDVSNKKYDFGGTAFTFTLDRSEIVEFSTPIHMIRWKFYYDRNEEAVNESTDWGTYYWPFQFASWVALIVYACVMIPIVFFNIYISKTENQLGSIQQSLKIMYLSLLGKNPGDIPKAKDSLKMIVFWISMTGFVFLCIYRTMLGASFTIKIEHKPFSSIQELAASSKRVILEDQTFIHQYVVNSSSPLAILDNSKLLAKNYFGNPEEALHKILNKTWSNSVLLGQRDTLEQLPQYPCLISSLDIVAAVRWMGFIYQKDWPFSKLFDWHLKNIVRDSGLFRKIYHQHVGHPSTCPNSSMTATYLSQTIMIFAILGIGFLATFCTLFIEMLSVPSRTKTMHEYHMAKNQHQDEPITEPSV